MTTNGLVALGLMVFFVCLAWVITRDARAAREQPLRWHLWGISGVLWCAAGGCGWAGIADFLAKI